LQQADNIAVFGLRSIAQPSLGCRIELLHFGNFNRRVLHYSSAALRGAVIDIVDKRKIITEAEQQSDGNNYAQPQPTFGAISNQSICLSFWYHSADMRHVM
jgi:hypothetical protein